MPYDVIVIGGGPNGLTAAGLLAKAGRKVVVLERREILGGVAALEEFHPGYKVPGLLHDTAGVRRGVAETLQLERHGLSWRADEVPVFFPQQQGHGLLLHRDPARARTEIQAFSQGDAEKYAGWRGFQERIRSFLSRLQDEPAPELGAQSLGDLWNLAGKALALRRLSEKDMMEFLRIGPMCVADWLNEWFETKLLKAGLAGPAVLGTWLGPWSAGTVVTLLLQESVAGREVLGGPAGLTAALAAACRSYGGEIRTSAAVKRLRIAAGRAEGVELESGESLDASRVVSSCDPRLTFLEMTPPRALPQDLEGVLRHWRCRGTTAKVHLALSGPLDFAGRPGGVFEAARTGEELDDLERAFDAVKYGEFSTLPVLDVRVPTLSDPGLAPKGHHVVSILASFAPYALRNGWTDASRKAFGDAVVAALARHAPSLPDRIVAGEVLSPLDLERRYGLTGGHLHHGEHSLDQLFSLRPSPSCSRHATPIHGLFLCGSGTHPGGGVTCAPGALAAAAILSRR